MLRRIPAVILVFLLVGFAVSCSQEQEAQTPSEAAFEDLKTAWNEAETGEAKTALAEEYLAQFPDTDHSASMAGVVVYYRGIEMEDPEGAFTVVSSALEHIEDPEQRFGVSMELLSLSDDVDVPIDLAQVAADLSGLRSLTFSEHMQVFETAEKLERWETCQEHASAALEFATPEAYRADYPDREYTDDEVESRAARRQALAATYSGWARYNQGDVDGAFVEFSVAEATQSLSYLGVPDNPLFKFWGRAALAQGDLENAIKMLASDTLFGEDDSALPFLREAYAAKNGNEEGFDEFLWKTRQQFAKSVDDFELPDYEGNAHRLGDVGDKVVLLAFWFPT